jgi:hypothetical protein
MKEGISQGLKPASLLDQIAKAKALAYLKTKTRSGVLRRRDALMRIEGNEVLD